MAEEKSLDPSKLVSSQQIKAWMDNSNVYTILNDILTTDPEKVLTDKMIDHPASFNLEAVVRDPAKEVDAQIIECDPIGRYRLVSYDKHGLYQRLTTAPVIRSAPCRQLTFREALVEKYGKFFKLKEDFGSTIGDPDMGVYGGKEPFANFTPLFIGPYYRNQYMYKMLEAKSKCYEAFVYNPVAHRIPSLITQFTLGKGVTVSTKSDRTREVWDKFARYNKIGTSMDVGLTRAGARLRMWSNQLSVDGELMLQFIPTPEMLKIHCVDSATVLDIVTDPENIDNVYYYHVQFATQFQMFVHGGIPGMKYVIRDIPGDQILHVKINVYENEKRGRSDLYSVIGYLKRLKDLINANIIKAYFQACYTYDVAVDGSPATVMELASKFKNQIPTPGSTYFHNKNITRTALPPISSTGAGTDNDMIGLMNLISLGTGIPPAYLIGTMAASRAGVLTETEPSSKFFFERQSIWDETLHSIYERLARWYYDRTGEMLDDNIEFSFPQINAVEKNSYLQSLIIMRDNQWFSDKRCAELAAKEFNVTSYNIIDEKKLIQEEQREKINQELEANKMRSAAQSHLSLWQSLLADSMSREKAQALGPDVGAQGGKVGEEGSNESEGGSGDSADVSEYVRRSAARGGKERKPVSGGLTDEERYRTRKKVIAEQPE